MIFGWNEQNNQIFWLQLMRILLNRLKWTSSLWCQAINILIESNLCVNCKSRFSSEWYESIIKEVSVRAFMFVFAVKWLLHSLLEIMGDFVPLHPWFANDLSAFSLILSVNRSEKWQFYFKIAQFFCCSLFASDLVMQASTMSDPKCERDENKRESEKEAMDCVRWIRVAVMVLT